MNKMISPSEEADASNTTLSEPTSSNDESEESEEELEFEIPEKEPV